MEFSLECIDTNNISLYDNHKKMGSKEESEVAGFLVFAPISGPCGTNFLTVRGTH